MEISQTAREKRMARYEAWLNAEGVKFETPQAEAAYKARVTRMIDAIELQKKPDRVPLLLFGTFMMPDLYGVSPADAMYDYPKMLSAQTQFLKDYTPDVYCSPAFIGSGRILEMLDYKLYKWPRGGGLPEDSLYQCIESEYMEADDYDWLINDPSDFWLRKYVPATFKKLAPLANISPFTHIWEVVGVSGQMIPFGIPEVQEALKTLMEAGTEAMKWIQHVGAWEMQAKGLGFPSGVGGASKAPFDMLADTLRGTRAMMMDMYRQPEKVLKAMERLVPTYIGQGVSMADQAQNPLVFMPLHKGADGFMSDEQFKKFYWPTLKAVMMGLIEEGCVPFMFCEGGYNSRLEYLQELPEASCFWIFDRTDMRKAKEMLGGQICIGGNVPAGMILTSKPDDVSTYCKGLIDDVGQDGGYIMAMGTSMDEGNAENLHAMVNTTLEHGTY